MLLCIDIGNTNIGLGLYKGGQWAAHWRLSTERQRTADEYAVAISGLMSMQGLRVDQVEGVALTSVVPPLNNTFDQMSRKTFGSAPFIVTNRTDCGVPVAYNRPEDVGGDRIVNAVGVIREYRTPAIVVDFGTATTFDAISADGVYLGGAIAPGLQISVQALFDRTARLPRIQLEPPQNAIGRTSVESMQAGILLTTAGGVDAMVRRFQRELGGNAVVIATGGLANTIASLSEEIEHVDEFLTLNGLRHIYAMHHGEA